MSVDMDKAMESRKEAEKKTQQMGTVNTSAGFGAGAGGGFGLNKPGFGPQVKHFAGKPTGKSIDISPDIVEAWKMVMDDTQPLGWVVAVYTENLKSLNLKASGDGGLKSFIAQLPRDALAWGGFRCYGVDKRGGLECKRAKFVFVQWCPEGISQIKRAKVSPHKGEVKESICGAHLDIVTENISDFDEMNLITQLQAATGAHKPNGYEFEAGEFIEADFYGLGIGKACRGETKVGVRDEASRMVVRRPSTGLICADDEDRPMNQARASTASDIEQLRRVGEVEQIDHDAKVERELNQKRASNAADVEQTRRVNELEAAECKAKLDRQQSQTDALAAMDAEQERLIAERGSERKKSIVVPDAGALETKVQEVAERSEERRKSLVVPDAAALATEVQEVMGESAAAA